MSGSEEKLSNAAMYVIHNMRKVIFCILFQEFFQLWICNQLMIENDLAYIHYVALTNKSFRFFFPFLYGTTEGVKAGLSEETLSLMPCLRTFSNVLY